MNNMLMGNNLGNSRISSRYAWVTGLRGIIAILFGLAVIIFPISAIIVLVYLFGAYALVDGIVAIVVSLEERRGFRRWWLLLIEGLIGVIIGILTFVSPIGTAFALLLFIAAWAVITGIVEIVSAFSVRTSVAQEWALGIGGALSLLLGILLFLRPGAGIFTIVLLIGFYAIMFGVLLLVRAFQLRSGHLTYR